MPNTKSSAAGSAKTERIVKSAGPKASLAKVTLVSVSDTIANSLKLVAAYLSKELTPKALSDVFFKLDELEKALQEMRENVKDRIKEAVKADGTKVPETLGSISLDVGNHKWNIRPTRTGYDPKKVEAALRSKDLQPADWMQTDIKYKVDETKFPKLVEKGIFTTEELEQLKYELKFALVTPKQNEAEHE